MMLPHATTALATSVAEAVAGAAAAAALATLLCHVFELPTLRY